MSEPAVVLPQLVFRAGEAAAALKVSVKSVYRLVQRGKLSSLKSIRHLRIPRESLEQFVAKNSGGG